MLCERCGSIEIRRARSNNFERLLRVFTGRKRFFCKRCGWTALRAWDETAPRVVTPKKVEKADLKLVDLSGIDEKIEADRSAKA